MAFQTVNLRLGVPGMTNRAVDFSQMGFVGVPVGEILGSRFGCQLVHGAMAFQALGVFHRIFLPGEVLAVASVAGDVLRHMTGVEIGGFRRGPASG